ncbi:MAG TPA: NnrU family protein [Rhodocyclaceae bacterium]|nr:NnrU family protein [Rhodocyclaceae bacterium]
MALLILGLIIFLGVHSIRLVAPSWRELQMQRRGVLVWKGLYAFVSLLGLVLIVYGYGQARMESALLWALPAWTRHLAALLMLLSFICVAAAYIPGNFIKARIGHPMLIGVKTWAFAHLLSNGTLADLVLFGSFLLWSILQFRASRRRDKLNGTVYAHLSITRDMLVLVLGVAGTGVFALFLHQMLIGVRPF